MKLSGVLNFGVLLVAFVASSGLVEAVRPACLCGGLGAGINQCRGEAAGVTHVKAAKSLRPSYFASESAINEAAAERASAAARAAAAARSQGSTVIRTGGGCGGVGRSGSSSSSSSSSSGNSEEYGLTARDLLSLDPRSKVAPRFRPIGDLCHQPRPAGVVRTSTTVIPAYPGRPRCFACDGRLGSYGSSSSSRSSSSSASSSSSRSSSATYGSAGGVAYGSHGSNGGYPFGNSGTSGGGSYNQHGSSYGGSHGSSFSGRSSGASGPFAALAAFGVSGPFGTSGSYGTSRTYNSLNSANTNLNDFESEDDGLSFDEQESIYNGQQLPTLPADAVSVSLAYKKLTSQLPRNVSNKKKIIVEERLSFGPRTIPTDGQVRPAPTTDIPEERLVTVDKPIVELKAFSTGRSGTGGGCTGSSADDEEDLIEQEAIERERMEQESEAQANQGPGAYITYSDLGYGPIAPSGNKFINSVTQTEYASTASADSMSSGATSYDDEIPCGPLGKPIPGYRAGNVIVRQEGEWDGAEASSRADEEVEEDSYDPIASYEEDDASSETSGRGHRGSSGTSRSSAGGLSRLWSTSSDGCRSSATCALQ